MSDMGISGEQQFCLRWNNHQANFIQAFEGLLEEETFADVTLAVEGVVLKCHKMVLAACSTYFKTLFSDVPCSHPVVFLKDVKVSEMKSILEYVYKGEVNVARNDLAAMLKVAQMLQIKGLMNTDSAMPPSERPLPESFADEKPSEEAISTSTASGQSPYAFEHGAGQSSPPHSTSSPYYGYRKSSGHRDNASKFQLPVWALAQGLPLVGQGAAAVSAAALHPSLAGRHSAIFGNLYENPNEPSTGHVSRKSKMSINNLMRNHDTPILRGVLGQVHADSSQYANNDGNDSHYRSHSNGSADNDSNGRRSSIDLSNGHYPHGHYPSANSMVVEDDDRKPNNQIYPDEKKPGNGNYGQPQKPEWKRYKQYTRADIANAIAAVKAGLSALQAARKFGVPSRTLYDKVKKLGITTSRPGRRTVNGNGAAITYGVGGNVNGNIYGPVTENNADNNGSIIDNPTTMLEASYAESREHSMDRESMMDQTSSPSPPLALCYPPQPIQQQHQQQQHQQQQQQEQLDEESDNEVEDLSVPRRPDVRVIMSPGAAIKEEA